MASIVMGQARSDPRPSRAWAFHSLQWGKEKFHFFAKKENLTNKNHNIILHLKVVNLSGNTYAMKSVIFKEIFFNGTQFFNEMLEKSNVHEKNVQKIVILNFNCKMFQKWWISRKVFLCFHCVLFFVKNFLCWKCKGFFLCEQKSQPFKNTYFEPEF